MTSKSKTAAVTNAVTEALESRRLLCGLPHAEAVSDIAPQYTPPDGVGARADTGGIIWSNRGTTDNFAAAYGSRANAARDVVDAAFYFWNQVISNFNQSGGNSQIDISVTAQARGTGWGGSGGVNTLLGNKPRTSSISLGGGGDADGNGTVGDAEGFYLDPTPYDYSEFQGNIVNAFVGRATAGGPADGLNDLFSLVTIEIQHALGIEDRFTNLAWRQDPNDYLRPAGTSHSTAANDGADTPGKLYYLNAPGIQALFTSNNGGSGGQDRGYAVHTARPSQSYTTGGVTYTGQLDTGTTGYLGAARYLPSYVGVQALGVMYGYTVNPPQDVIGTFYSVPDRAARRVLVRNPDATSSDRMEMRSSSGGIFITLDIGNDVAGTNMGGPFVAQFSRLAFDSVIMDGGGGTDFIRADGNDSAPVTLRGGDGDDFLDLGFVQRNLDLITGAVAAEGGNNYDRIFIYDDLDASADTFTVNNNTFDSSGSFNLLTFSGVEELNPKTGTAADTVNILATPAGTSMFVNSTGGTDVVNIGNAGNGVRSINAPIQIDNTPSFTTLNINNAADTTARQVFAQSSGSYGVIGGLAPWLISYKYADVSSVNVTLGTGSDRVDILAAAKPLTFTASNGFQTNTFNLGNASEGTGGITANLRILAFGFAANNIVVDNFSGANRTATLAQGAPGEFVLSGFTGGGTITYNRQAFNSGESLTIRGGFGNESLSINNVIDSNAVTFDGRGGFDTLTVDDRLQTNVPNTTTFTSTSIVRTQGPFPLITYFTTIYADLESVTYFAHPGATTTNITGVPSSIPAGQQATIFLGNNSDVVNLSPRDANGDLTINGNIGIVGGGGTDTFRVNDAGSTGPINYMFSNPFGSGTQNVFGLGIGGVGTASIENWEVRAGGGDDVFNMSQWTSGNSLGIYGGDGDDVLNFGNGHIQANITSISAFGFDGQGGRDTWNMLNASSNAGAPTYTRDQNFVGLLGFGGSYSLGMNEANVELVRFDGYNAGETLRARYVAPGSSLEFNAAGGIDSLVVGNANNSADNIFGPITYDAGASGGQATVNDQADTTGDTFHLDQNSLGAYAGDDLFGSGGSLTFSGLTDFMFITLTPALTVNLGSGSDVAYAQPLQSGTATINFNGQNFTDDSDGVGDGLNLALASAVDYVITDGASGNVTSASTGRLNWNGLELPVAVDDVAPTALSGDFAYDVPAQTVTIAFDDDVSNSLTTASFILTNLTTGEEISQGVMSLAFDTSTNTATVTFPGLSNGALPDGNYLARLAPSYSDFFGNAASNQLEFEFFVFAGDANHDRSVNINDFAALAANFNSPGTFSDGDFNYNGTIEIQDFAILASKFNQSLDPPVAIASRPAPATMTSSSAAMAATSSSPSPFSTRSIYDESADWVGLRF